MPTQVSAIAAVPRQVRVLAIRDDAIGVAPWTRTLQESPGFVVEDVAFPAAARTMLARKPFDVAVVDHRAWCAQSQTSAPVREALASHDSLGVVVVGRACEGGGCGLDDGHERYVAIDGDGWQREPLIEAIGRAWGAGRARLRRETLTRWLQREAATDPLTGLPKHGPFEDTLHRTCTDATGGSVGLILLRIPDLGGIQFRYGRESSDRIVQRVGNSIRGAIRHTDFAARLNTDTFAVVVHNADMDACRRVARRVSHQIDAADDGDHGTATPLPIVFGAAAATGCSGRTLYEAARDQLQEQRQNVTSLAAHGRRSGDGPSVA